MKREELENERVYLGPNNTFDPVLGGVARQELMLVGGKRGSGKSITSSNIFELAQKAGFDLTMWYTSIGCEVKGTYEELERFAALVAAAEREECAKVCENIDLVEFEYCMVLHIDGHATLRNAAAAIRARGEK